MGAGTSSGLNSVLLFEESLGCFGAFGGLKFNLRATVEQSRVRPHYPIFKKLGDSALTASLTSSRLARRLRPPGDDLCPLSEVGA